MVGSRGSPHPWRPGSEDVRWMGQPAWIGHRVSAPLTRQPTRWRLFLPPVLRVGASQVRRQPAPPRRPQANTAPRPPRSRPGAACAVMHTACHVCLANVHSMGRNGAVRTPAPARSHLDKAQATHINTLRRRAHNVAAPSAAAPAGRVGRLCRDPQARAQSETCRGREKGDGAYPQHGHPGRPRLRRAGDAEGHSRDAAQLAAHCGPEEGGAEASRVVAAHDAGDRSPPERQGMQGIEYATSVAHCAWEPCRLGWGRDRRFKV